MAKRKLKEVLIILKNYKNKPNEYETKNEISYIKIAKKNGTLIDALIDTEDLEKVLTNKTWFAEWHKDFNSYLVQSIEGKAKQTLQSFILDVHPKTTIRHINGDTLDNRKCNLEVYNQNAINDYRVLDEETIELILRDKYGKENATTLIDKEDLYRVQNNGYSWVYYVSNKLPYAIANTPKGRLYLNKFIMNTPENMVTESINLNTLDNRKVNLKNVSLDEE